MDVPHESENRAVVCFIDSSPAHVPKGFRVSTTDGPAQADHCITHRSQDMRKPRCPSTDKELWYVYSMELQSVTRNEMMLFSGKQNWRRWNWRSKLTRLRKGNITYCLSHAKSPQAPTTSHTNVHTCVWKRHDSRKKTIRKEGLKRSERKQWNEVFALRLQHKDVS